MFRRILGLLVLLAVPAAGEVPGLVAGTGDDQTLALLYGLEEFQNLDPVELPTRLWFDPYRGDDAANNGSILAPYRSIAKLKSVCTSQVRCTVYGADRVFSPLTLRMTGIDPGENYQRGETLTWDAGSSSGTVLDWSSVYGILVIDWDTGALPVDGETGLLGSSSGAEGDIREGQGILNTVGGHVVYSFAPTAIDTATGAISIQGHSYVDREGPMRLFSNGALPAELSQDTDYTICAATPDTFRLDDDSDCASPIPGYASIGSGSHGIAGASNALVDDPILPTCNDPDRICVLIESQDPAHPAVIDGNRYHATGYDNRNAPGVFGPNPDGGLAFVSGPGNGWVGWQNLQIQNIAIDAFSNQSSAVGKLVALNSPARDIRNGSENRSSDVGANNCYTSHGGGAVIALNGGGSESRVDDPLARGRGACLAPTGTSKFTLIGTGTYRSERVGVSASSTLASTGGDIALIGHELLGATTGNSVIQFGSSDGDTRVQLARTLLRAAPADGGSGFGILGGGYATTVRIFETTMHGNQTQFGEALWIGNIGQSGLDFSAKGLLIDDYPIWLETLNRDSSFQNTNPFALEGYFDDEDAAGGDEIEFFFGGPGGILLPTSVAEAQAAAQTFGALNWALFQNRSRNSNGAAPGSAWLSDTQLLRCQPSEACWGAYREWYPIALGTIHGSDPDLSCIPADVLGERICAFRLRGTHIGARGAPDADADVLADTTEASLGTDPFDPDSDGDGLEDGFEVANGFDPLAPGEAALDPDGDGLDNLGEQTHGTDPHDTDSDDDNFIDLVEAQAGSNPLDANSIPITALPGIGSTGLALAAALLAASAAGALWRMPR